MAGETALLSIERPQKKLRDLVQDALREAILDLRFAPGERLVERTLCEQLGVSRTVVREVLRYLEAEGLVEVSPNRGPVIATMKPEDAQQIYELRILLEGMAAAACAERATAAELDMLRTAIDDIRVASVEKDARLSLRATNRFYQHVFQIAGKTIAWTMLSPLTVRINALRVMTITSPERQAASALEMESIMTAIEAGHPEQARQAAAEHARQAGAVAASMLVHGAEKLDRSE